MGAADWLCLAAAPSFAVMALLTGVLDGGRPEMLCSATPDASPLSGMAAMYLLMSAFHTAPWLKLIASRGSDAPRPGCGASDELRLQKMNSSSASDSSDVGAVAPSADAIPHASSTA